MMRNIARLVLHNARQISVCALMAAFFLVAGSSANAQVPFLPGQDLPEQENSTAQEDSTEVMTPGPPSIDPDSLPPGLNQNFSFDDSSMNFEESAEDKEEKARQEAFDAALQGLLPLRPQEIRTLLERFDRTQESVETPVYPPPKPEVVVEHISLDPGAKPLVIKMAYGHVSTVTFLDASGSPWPVKDISWAGNFEVINSPSGGGEGDDQGQSFNHMFRISPQSEFAYGNMSISLLGLQTPVIITLETNRDIVHYRVDAVLPEYGPLAEAPLIQTGITTVAGSPELSSMLEGIAPEGAVRLNVSGTDGRTSAYRYNHQVYVRTPLTLLSPGWSSSVTSADGTKVYEIADAPVLLFSERGKMVRARLSDREDILDEQ